MYKLNSNDKKRIDRQVNDIANGTEKWAGFKKGAIYTLKNKYKTYQCWFAEREGLIACETGINSGSCGPDECETCEVNRALEEALMEIKAGLRKKDEHKFIEGYERRIKVSMKKNGTIVITQTLR